MAALGAGVIFLAGRGRNLLLLVNASARLISVLMPFIFNRGFHQLSIFP
jgi:hypothetical protein